jgi:hypothetical protein
MGRGHLPNFRELRTWEVARMHLLGTWVNILKRPSCTSTDCVWRFNSPACCPRKPLPSVLLRSS